MMGQSKQAWLDSLPDSEDPDENDDQLRWEYEKSEQEKRDDYYREQYADGNDDLGGGVPEDRSDNG